MLRGRTSCGSLCWRGMWRRGGTWPTAHPPHHDKTRTHLCEHTEWGWWLYLISREALNAYAVCFRYTQAQCSLLRRAMHALSDKSWLCVVNEWHRHRITPLRASGDLKRCPCVGALMIIMMLYRVSAREEIDVFVFVLQSLANTCFRC